MAFDIILAPQALEDLKALKATLRATVKDAMQRHLGEEPEKVSRSRIKRLRGLSQPQYRLRVADVRVFYDVIVAEARVEVLAVVPKSETEKWLAQFGKPQVPPESAKSPSPN